MIPGLFGREPWKPDEAYTFDLIWQAIRDGHWLVPHLAGEPFIEKPPLFFWTAAGLVQVFGGLGAVNAARLANMLFVGTTSACIALAGRRGRRGAAVMALIATPGLLAQVHLLTTDLALMAGMSMSLLGLLSARTAARPGGLLLGTGLGVAFMAKGLIGPGIMLPVMLSLPVFDRAWRQGNYLRSLAWACCAFSPWLLVWPTLLYLRYPELFRIWLWDNNFGRFFGHNDLGPSAALGEKLALMIVFVIPGVPLALRNLYEELRAAGRLQADTMAPLLTCVAGFALLISSAQFRGVYMLPILPALAVLSAREIRGGKTYCLALAVIGCLLATLFVAWLGLTLDWQSAALDRFFSARWISPPDERVSAACVLTIGTVIILLAALVWHTRKARQVLTLWAGGLATSWFAFAGLLLPWLAPGNDYRLVMHEIAVQVAAVGPDCLASQALGEPQRGMLDYYAGLQTKRLENGQGKACTLLLEQRSGRPQQAGDGTAQETLAAGWRAIWQGARTGDNKEYFRLLQKATD